MSDQIPSSDPPRHENLDRPGPQRTNNVPPLAWIIGLILVVVVILAAVQRGGTHVTPQGGATPMAEPPPTTMPESR